MVKNASPQAIFGEMVKASIGIIQSFHSDLYHDAVGMHQKAKGPDTVGYFELRAPFLWFVGHMGTHLYWLDGEASRPTVELVAQTYPYIYFYDGYTLAQVGLEDAISAVQGVRNMYY
jgi:hypothetical protein